MSVLPSDIQDRIFEYWNPYKEYYKNHIVKDEIWKKSWKMWYNREENRKNDLLQFFMYYYFCKWGIFHDPEYRERFNCMDAVSPDKKYFFTDIKIHITEKNQLYQYDCYHVMMEMKIPCSKDCFWIENNVTVFQGMITNFCRMSDDLIQYHNYLQERSSFTKVLETSKWPNLVLYELDTSWSPRIRVL